MWKKDIFPPDKTVFAYYGWLTREIPHAQKGAPKPSPYPHTAAGRNCWFCSHKMSLCLSLWLKLKTCKSDEWRHGCSLIRTFRSWKLWIMEHELDSHSKPDTLNTPTCTIWFLSAPPGVTDRSPSQPQKNTAFNPTGGLNKCSHHFVPRSWSLPCACVVSVRLHVCCRD